MKPLPTCDICGKPSVGNLYFDALTIRGTPSHPSAIASGLHARCAEHRPTELPSIVPIPPWLASDATTDFIDMTDRLVSCALSFSSEPESYTPLTLTYKVDLSPHQVDGDRVALGQA